MTTYLGKSCSFCLPRVPFVNCRQFMYLVISLFGFEGRIWDLIISVPDHCLSFYFTNLEPKTVIRIRFSGCYMRKNFIFNKYTNSTTFAKIRLFPTLRIKCVTANVMVSYLSVFVSLTQNMSCSLTVSINSG